jgi:hypothetical protein
MYPPPLNQRNRFMECETGSNNLVKLSKVGSNVTESPCPCGGSAVQCPQNSRVSIVNGFHSSGHLHSLCSNNTIVHSWSNSCPRTWLFICYKARMASFPSGLATPKSLHTTAAWVWVSCLVKNMIGKMPSLTSKKNLLEKFHSKFSLTRWKKTFPIFKKKNLFEKFLSTCCCSLTLLKETTFRT